eukprot:Skav215370  [mRNA]  locus=scaffold1391:830199:833557:+ [translate_table: standard]
MRVFLNTLWGVRIAVHQIGGSPKNQIKLLVQATLRMNEGIPGWHVVQNAVNLVPSGQLGFRCSWLILTQDPTICTHSALASHKFWARHRGAEQFLIHIEAATQLPLRPFLLETARQALEPGTLLGAAHQGVQNQETFVPFQQ